MRRLMTLGILLVLALAGCLQPPETEAAVDDVSVPGSGTMTAEETRTDDSGLCTDGLQLGSGERFCATRTIAVEGKLSGFSNMDVALETFNGDVTISEAREGTWGFVATLTARGSSQDEAVRKIDEITFSWAHEDAGTHLVEILAELEGSANNVGAEIALTMPRSVLLSVVGTTSNGNVVMEGGRASALALTSSNGEVRATTSVGQASLTTSNGAISAELTPLDDGRWALTTSNGDVTLVVPEGPRYGYSFDGTTSNGEVEYGMTDGEKGPCPEGSEYYTPPCNSRTFETSGFRGRELQVRATLVTSNGDVSANPS